jgi:hypothetical protein
MGEGFDFDIEAPDLRGLIQHVRDFEPRLATALRREFRQSGGEIIGAQREALGSGETRDQIAAGLRTRVTAGATRQSVSIASGGPTKGGASLAKVFERRTFRHPVFGSEAWVDQPGRPYFNKPVKDGAERMRERLDQAVDDILERIAKA